MNLDQYNHAGDFLKQGDVGSTPIKVTIESFQEIDLGDDHPKPAVKFRGSDKLLVLNATNRGYLIATFGPDTDAMIGAEVEVYVDPTVMYAGRAVGGLRLRSPTQPPVQHRHEDSRFL